MRSTTQRGYGSQHQRERAKWEPLIKQGGVNCARCQEPIKPDQAWDLGHNDDRSGYNGPECVPCNRGAGGANGAAAMHAKRRTVTRDW